MKSRSALPALCWVLAACGPGLVDDGTLDPGGSPYISNGQLDDGHPMVGKLRFDTGSCTGTLIDAKTVLTAAHCVDGQRTATFTIEGGEAVNATALVAHPGYDPPSGLIDRGVAVFKTIFSTQLLKGRLNLGDAVGWDLAVVKLERAIAGVPSAGLYRQQPVEGTPFEVVGYGLVKSTAAYDGKKRTGRNEVDVEYSKTFGYDNNADGETAAAICNGDSGGPHFVKQGERHYLMGVTSYMAKNGLVQLISKIVGDGDMCNAAHYVATRVDKPEAYDWIRSQMEASGASEQPAGDPAPGSGSPSSEPPSSEPPSSEPPSSEPPSSEPPAAEPTPNGSDWGPCQVGDKVGRCIPTGECATSSGAPFGISFGYCPGPADIQCCLP